MLNPSTADAEVNDPTIRKCLGFAKELGFKAIEVVNLYAFRATHPIDLEAAGFPPGDENDAYIAHAVALAGEYPVICAWGRNGHGSLQARHVLELVRRFGGAPYALRKSEDGCPWHPLMLPYASKLEPL
jgi:hypothetical protein